jgi:outer membrane protein assembly factor BamB
MLRAIYEGVVYAGSNDGNVYAVDYDRVPAWAALKGVFTTSGPIRGDITAEKSGVYVASADSKLYCLDPRNGKIQWEYYAGFPLFDSPAVTATTVYINVRGQGVAAIDKGEGEYNRKARWSAPGTTQFLAEDDQYAFLLGKGNSIVAVDKKTGEQKFTSQRNDLVAFAINTSDGVIYAATKKGKIIAAVAVQRHGEVGELVWAEPANAPAYN